MPLTTRCMLHYILGNKGEESKNVTGDEPREVVPFHETRFYVPSSYSAGPDPKRASMQTSSGSFSTTVNIILITFFVLLSIGLAILCSWLLWRSHKQQILETFSWTQQHVFRMNQRNGEFEQGAKVTFLCYYYSMSTNDYITSYAYLFLFL